MRTSSARRVAPQTSPALLNGVPKELTELTKRQRFARHAPRRLGLVIKTIDQLIHCAGQEQYEFSPVEAARLIQLVEAKTKQLRQAFESGKSAPPVDFLDPDPV